MKSVFFSHRWAWNVAADWQGGCFWGILLWVCCAATAPVQAVSQPEVIHLATANSNYHAAFKKIAQRYEALHPEVKIKISIVTNDFSAWLRTQFAGGERMAPDIYNGNYTADYIALGRWEPLNRSLEATNPYTGHPWMDSLDQRLVNRFAFNGNIYYVPLDYLDAGFVYNCEVFRQLGLEPPSTWSQLIHVCQVIEEQGQTVMLNGQSGQPLIPMSMPGNAKEFWEGAVGWLTRILTDAYHRSEVATVMARPGDWCYNPDTDRTFDSNFANQYNDIYTTLNHEREINGFLNGTLRIDTPKMRSAYAHLQELSHYWPSGYQGLDGGMAYNLFFQQRAAMLFTLSHFVTVADNVFAKMPASERFEWAAFSLPSIDDDPLCESPTLRGIGNAGANLVVTRKSDPAHVRRAVDFLMFMTTPQSGQDLLDETLADEQFVFGPICIEGVQMPPDMQCKFEPFMNRGFEKISFRPVVMEMEWVQITQELLGGKLSLDEFLKQYQQLMLNAIHTEIRRYGYDLNPQTQDLTDPLSSAQPQKNLFNPIENGILTVAIIVVLLLALMSMGLMRVRGLKRRHAWLAYGLLLPTFLLLAVFNAYPVIAAFYRSFTLWEEGRRAVFTGLENFSRLMSDYVLLHSTLNMVVLTVANLLKATIVPFLVARLILSLSSTRLQYFFRNLFLVPVVVPAITMILIWGLIYEPNIGVLNSLLRMVGMDGHNWLGEHSLALPSIIGFGFPWIGALGLLVYMAGLLQIDHSVLEAARLDCRNSFQRLIHIDVPLVRAQTKFLAIITLIGSIQDFQSILLLTNGGPGISTTVPALLMYHRAFKIGEFGYASSIGLVLFVVILVLTLINLKFIKVEEQ